MSSLSFLLCKYMLTKITYLLHSSILNSKTHYYLSTWSACFIEIPVFNVNSVDPDQMPPSAAASVIWVCTVYQLPFKGSW